MPPWYHAPPSVRPSTQRSRLRGVIVNKAVLRCSENKADRRKSRAHNTDRLAYSCICSHLRPLTFYSPHICNSSHLHFLTIASPHTCVCSHLRLLTFTSPYICISLHLRLLTFASPYICVSSHLCLLPSASP